MALTLPQLACAQRLQRIALGEDPSEFEKRWGRYARPVGGMWTLLHRAVDKQGRIVNFYLSAKRDVSAAK